MIGKLGPGDRMFVGIILAIVGNVGLYLHANPLIIVSLSGICGEFILEEDCLYCP